MKFTFVFILILFIDSINRVYRVQADLIAAKNNENSGYVPPLATAIPPRDRILVPSLSLLSRRSNDWHPPPLTCPIPRTDSDKPGQPD